MALNKPKPLPSLSELNKILRLDVETGHLFWRERTESLVSNWFNSRFAGKRADRLLGDPKYYSVKMLVDGKSHRFLAHRLIWKMVNGLDPYLLIDHIDRNPRNNKPSNLREANYRENSANRSMTRAGSVGVYPTKSGKFRSQINKRGRVTHLGTFETQPEASEAFKAAAQS